jgi:hypothetical protein
MSDFNLDDDIFGTEDNLDFTQEDIVFEDDLTTISTTDDSTFDDSFDQLRDKTVRGETVDNNLAADEEVMEDIVAEENASSSSGGFSLDQFSPGQRLVLAILVILNIIVIGFGLLVVLTGYAIWLGSISPFFVLPLFFWLITTQQIIPEEKILEDKFGKE